MFLVPAGPSSHGLYRVSVTGNRRTRLGSTLLLSHFELKLGKAIVLIGRKTDVSLLCGTIYPVQLRFLAASQASFSGEAESVPFHEVRSFECNTDAFYDASKKHDDEDKTADRPGNYHYDLPTVLDDKYLAVDVARWGPFVEIRINAFSRVTIHDGVASDGVIQVVSDVLIPPKSANGEQVMWQGEELSVEEFKERLAPFADENMEL